MFTLLICVSINSCSTKEQKTENVQEKVLGVKDDLSQLRKDYVAESEKLIKENKILIDGLKTKISDSNKKMKEEFLERLQRLDQKNIELQAKLVDYKEEGQEKWDEFKQEFNHDMEILGKGLKDLTLDNKK